DLSNPSSVLPQSWSEVLENVQRDLTQLEAEAARFAQSAESAAVAAAPVEDRDAARRQVLASFEAHCLRLQDSITQAGQLAVVVDEVLENTEQTLCGWRTQAETVRQSLE